MINTLLGIKKQMNLALAKYNKGDEDNFEDIAESLIIVRNHLDLLAKLFHTFDSSKYFNGTTIQQLNTLNMAAEFAQQSKDFDLFSEARIIRLLLEKQHLKHQIARVY